MIGMQDLLGGILLVCNLLADQTTPSCRFKNCVLECTEDKNANRLPVDINIPITVSVACSILAESQKDRLHYMLVDFNLYSKQDCISPCIFGVNFGDIDLLHEISRLCREL